MKKMLLFFLLFVSTVPSTRTGQAANTVTVIGSTDQSAPQYVATDFSQYGLSAKTFDVQQFAPGKEDITQQLKESINDSLLVIFGNQVPGKVYNQVFASEADSLTDMLKRGGALYFGSVSWDILCEINKANDGTKTFFNSVNAFLISTVNYVGEKPDYYYTGVPNPDIKHPFTSEPNNLADSWKGVTSIRVFAGEMPESCKPILIDKKKSAAVMIVQDSILSKGSIINSYDYETLRSRTSEFMENVVRNLYGEKKK